MQEEEIKENEGQRWEDIPIDWNVQWLRRYNFQAGASNQLPIENLTPLEYFQLFFDNEVLDHLVLETNRMLISFFKETLTIKSQGIMKDGSQ